MRPARRTEGIILAALQTNLLWLSLYAICAVLPYRNIITYTLIEDEDDACRYNRKACIAAIRRRLRELNVFLQIDGHPITFSKNHFQLFSNAFAFRGNSEYCKKYIRRGKTEFFYSAKAIDLIVSQIQVNPTTAISNLQARRNEYTKD